MKILIAFFSGTGNTYYCANYVKNRLEVMGEEVSIRSIEDLKQEEISNFDILIIGFPVYACDLPTIMKNYLNTIPLTRSKKAYAFCTKGFYSGNALRKAEDLLKNRGYHVLGCADITMPGSDGLVFLDKDSSAAKKLRKKDFTKMEVLDRMVESITFDLKNIEQTTGNRIRIKIAGIAADAIFGVFFNHIKSKMTKKFFADENCVGCCYCEKICPAHNISVTNNKVSFGDHCYLCMRCINQCPTSSIQMGKHTSGKLRWKGPNNDFHPLSDINE